MPPDNYGRDVSLTVIGDQDTYTVVDNTGHGVDGTSFTVSFDNGAPLSQVYSTINAMAPSWWVPPQDGG